MYPSRSDIAWKDAKYAQIWEYLRDEFELTQRFASLDFKLKFVEVPSFLGPLYHVHLTFSIASRGLLTTLIEYLFFTRAAQYSFPSRDSPEQEIRFPRVADYHSNWC